MIETAKMSERGQIIIPKEVRDTLNAKENTLFAVSAIDDKTIVMKKIDTNSLVEEFKNYRANSKKLGQREIDAEVRAVRKTKGGR
jgi:AbrB family looped-hinge helix DNA binding protein